MNIVVSYFKNNFKIILVILVIIFVFFGITLVNQGTISLSIFGEEDLYANVVSKRIRDNDFDGIDYALLDKDLANVDSILKEQLALDISRAKKSNYYEVACKIYTEKINELISIFSKKLDDEDFERLQVDIDEFERNLDYAVNDIDRKHSSSFDRIYYSNKYIYEEKQKKCREILETYKGFLQ